MNPRRLLQWSKENIRLFLLLLAMGCLVLALGQVVEGVTLTLLMPVAGTAALCGWLMGVRREKGSRAIGWLVGLGVGGACIYITGLGRPLGNLVLSVFSLASPIILHWLERTPVDFTPLNASWSGLIHYSAGILSHLSAWGGALAAGKAATDPFVTGLAWSILLLLLGFWSGWCLYRQRQALGALAPGGLVLALVMDYSGSRAGLMVLYLAIMLILTGVSSHDGLHAGWQRRGVDFSNSIAIDSTIPIILLTVLLAGAAAVTPSFSWQDLVERVRERHPEGDDRVAQSLGLENPRDADVYGSKGLARHQLLGIPPAQSQELVFTVSTGEIQPAAYPNVPIRAQQYYWRTMTYDVYTGVGWSSSPVQNTSLPANTSLMEIPAGYRVIRQQVHVASDQNERLYWSGNLVQADAELEIAWRIPPPPIPSPSHAGDMLGPLTHGTDYNVVSILPQVSTAQLRAAGNAYPPEVSGSFLQLPKSIPERVLALARELVKASPTPYERALAIETYLRGFPYSVEVEPAPPGRDVVDYFLFTAQKGYCSTYASAMVVLARAAGIPARIVYGYAGGIYNPAKAQYEVHQADAHTWPEIYFPGIGWVEFEPTASLPEISRMSGIELSRPASATAPGSRVKEWLQELWRFLVVTVSGRLLLAAAGLAGLFALWQAGEIWILHLVPAPRAVHSLYTRLEKNSARLVPELVPGHTPRELEDAVLHRLENMKKRWFRPGVGSFSREVEQIVSLFEKQNFSRKAPGRPQIRAGIKAWARLRWALWMVGASD
jgi:transglutaminase-like putative cysteine protease